MKKFFFLLCLLIIYLPSIYSQEFITLAYWDFKDGDSVVDSAISINANKEIQVNFEGTITYPSSSSPKAISSTGWANGSNTKYWLIDINTTGYKNICISSKQYSTSKGPRDFKVQYRLNGTSWTDVENSGIIVVTNFTSGVAENILLPNICNNQEQIFIRWIMASDTNVDGTIITNAGGSRIADIIVEGVALEQFQQYSLTIGQIGNGIITPDTGVYNYNPQTNITIKAEAIEGYNFSGWSGDLISSNESEQIRIDSNISITANFTEIKYQIFLNEIIGGNAEILVSQKDDISFNDSIIVRINAIEKGKNVKSFAITDSDGNSVDVESLSEENTYTFFMPAKDVLITLELEQTITLLTQWDFIDGDVIVDTSDVQNNSAEITTNAGILSFPTTSSPKAGSSTGWINGMDNKYWATTINTSDYENISLSSKQYSSAKGPRDFKIQCRLNGTEWIDVENSEIIVATNFTSSVIENI
ncbi:hypothetical protein LJC16_03375, partial [Bacteroidales bacterium OttesenSCG-928-C19]|nr:hypothetical protein [Bacteroidales bacterium OttesenSCG-928-C19]